MGKQMNRNNKSETFAWIDSKNTHTHARENMEIVSGDQAETSVRV